MPHARKIRILSTIYAYREQRRTSFISNDAWALIDFHERPCDSDTAFWKDNAFSVFIDLLNNHLAGSISGSSVAPIIALESPTLAAYTSPSTNNTNTPVHPDMLISTFDYTVKCFKL